MATINFPASPAVGQEYPFGGFIYVWDGFKWTTKVQAVGTAYVQETAPPTTALPGSTWFCTANGMSYTLYTDADSTQWIESNPNHPVANSEITADAIGAVKKSGDTMTGALTQSSTGSIGVRLGSDSGTSEVAFLDATAMNRVRAIYDNTGGTFTFNTYDAAGNWQQQALGISVDPAVGVWTKAPQGGAGDSLVRKDFVDNSFVSKSGGSMSGTLANERVSGSYDDYSAFAGNVEAAGFDGMATSRRGVYHSYTASNDVSYAPASSHSYTNTTYGHTGKWSQGTLGVGTPNLTWTLYHTDVDGNNERAWYFNSDNGAFSSPGPIYQNGGVPVATVEHTSALELRIDALLARIEALEGGS